MQPVVGKSCSEPAFRRNTAERVYTIEAAHNPEVAGSNPAPATAKGAGNGAFRLLGDAWRCGSSAQRPVADPVARAGAEACGAVVRIGELTAIERETTATDALGEPEL
jgi:hypothetical protein